MKIVLYLGITLILSSCATVFNNMGKQVDIITTTPGKIIYNKDTSSNFASLTKILVIRKRAPLKLTVITDSSSKTLLIKSKNSFAYWLNAYPGPWLWMGFLIDKNNPKRFTYPGRIYVNPSDGTSNYYLYDPRSRKGQVYLHFSFPYINNFILKPDHESVKSNTGFWGMALGLDYYYNKQQFISLTGSGVMDFFIPFPAAPDYSGYNETMSSVYLGLSNNYKLRNFLLGYGLCYSRNTWNLHYYDSFDPPPLTREPVKKSNCAIGFIFPMYYQFGKYFFAGLVYRPTFIRFLTKTPLIYEHLISIDFGWKILLKR